MASGPKNSPKMKVHQQSFVGGQSIDLKVGIANSHASSVAMDFRQKASQMSVLPGFRNLSNSLNDLITVMEQTPDGVRYAVGDQGWIYRDSIINVVSNIGRLKTNGAAGLVYNQQTDQLYMSDQQTISLYGQILAGNPQLRAGTFGASASVANGVIYIFNSSSLAYDGNVDNNTGLITQRNNLNKLTTSGITPSNYAAQVTNTLTNTYMIPSIISEVYGQYCQFVPDIEPFYGVAVYVSTVGTGDWMLTMHDSLNNNLDAVTITHANMISGWNLFKFMTPGIRAVINPIANGTGEGNHFHLTSSVAADTAAVFTIAPGDMTGTNFILFAHRLVQTNNGWHPMTNFNGMLCTGNGPYLSTYNYANDASPNNSQFVRHRLLFDFGYDTTSVSSNNQFIVIAAEKRSTQPTRNFQDGFLYIWDGLNASWNQKIEVTMGAPYSVSSNNNVTYFYCAGSLFAWGGGQQLIKVRYMAYQNTDYLGMVDSTIVNPNMMDIRYNLLMLGYPSSTTNNNVNMGIYSWGAVELTYPNSFGYSYTIASGQQNNNGIYNSSSYTGLQIGMIKNFVDAMYQSWQYTDSNSIVHYGLDVLDTTSTAAPIFNWMSLIWDGGVRYKIKRAWRFRINLLPLPIGATLTAQYIADRGSIVSADPASGVSYSANIGDTAITVEISQLRFKEIQFGFTGTNAAGVTVPVTITGVTLELDPKGTEIDIFNDQKG